MNAYYPTPAPLATIPPNLRIVSPLVSQLSRPHFTHFELSHHWHDNWKRQPKQINSAF